MANLSNWTNWSKKLPIYLLGILLFTGVALIWWSNLSPKAHAAWFDDFFAYRQTVSFTHNANVTTDSRVNLTINTSTLVTANKMQSDCDDTRFTDPSGKVLRFQLVSGCNTSSTSYDVILPKIFNAVNYFYIYYGNPNATSVSQDVSATTSLSPSGGAASMATEEQAPSPVAYWKFDEGQGTVANDSTTNGNNGTLSGTTKPAWQLEDQCVAGKCLFFDGSTSYITAGTGSTVTITTALTVSAWIKLSNNTAVHDVVSKYGASGQFGWRLYTDASGKANFAVSDDGTGGAHLFTATGTTTLNAGQWYHLVGVYNPSTSVIIYVNGNEDYRNTSSIPATIKGNGTANVEIGSENGGSATNIMKGFIEEVRIFNSARTAAQIKSSYAAGANSLKTAKGIAAGLGAFPGNSPALNQGLVGYWKMDEPIWTRDCSTATASDSAQINTAAKSCPSTTGPTTSPTAVNKQAKFGNAGDFDGSNDYLEVANNSALNNTNVTLAAWIRQTTLNGVVIQKATGAGGTDGYYLDISSSKIRFCGTGGCVSSSTALTASTWTHVAATYDGTTVKFFFNGAFDGSSTGTITSVATNSLVLRMGADSTGATRFTGQIDEARVYNRALSPGEVQQLYNFAPGPIGYWKFEERTGTTAYDSSGNGKNGILSGATIPTWTTGKFGSALQYDGSASFVDIGDELDDKLINGSMTIEAWFFVTNANSVNDTVIIINKQDASGVTYRLNIDNISGSKKLSTIFGVGGPQTSSNATIASSTWVHGAAVHDATKGIDYLYVNGVFDTSQANTFLITDIAAITSFGYNNQFPGSYLAGKIDEIRIYNYARTPGQIVQDMNAGNPLGGSPVGSQANYWKLDDSFGVVASDSGTQKNHGSMFNMDSPPSVGLSGWQKAGKFGGSLAFDGTNDRVDLGDLTHTESIGTMSATFWVNPNSLATNKCLICKWFGTNTASKQSFAIETGNSAQSAIQLEISNDGNATNARAETPTGKLTVGTWTHVAVVYDATLPGNVNRVQIYINGTPQSLTFTGTIPSNTQATTSNATLGASADFARFFSGQLDEVKIYLGALSQQDVLVDMNHGSGVALGGFGVNTFDGKTASQSAGTIYCVPGDTTSCNAPQGEWNFEEGQGSTVHDTGGSSLDGTWNGTGVAHWSTGYFGKAGNFNGTDDYVNLGDILDQTSNDTIQAWILTNDIVNDHIALDKTGGANATSYRIYLNGGPGTPTFATGGSSPGNTITGTNQLPLNTWVFVTGTFNSSSTTSKIYINGRIEGVKTSANAPTSSAGTNTIIGANSGVSFQFWSGKVDGVKIYNYTRSPGQIAQDMNHGKPMLWWKFDECQGATANDSISTRSGTITPGAGSQATVGNCTTNASTMWYNGRTGKYNGSLNFEGTDDYVVSSNTDFVATAPNTSKNFSWGGWFYPTTSAVSKTLIHKNKEFRLTTDGSSQPNCSIYSGGAFVTSAVSTQALTLSAWNHVLCTYDGTNIKVYVNGNLIAQAAQTGAVTADVTTALNVGRDSAASGFFSGQIDEIKFWTYDLTAYQAKIEYNQASAVRFGPSTGSP